MEQIASPDLPAFWCYLVVLVVGMIVARGTVQRLLADQPSYWGYLNTWVLFIVYSVLPAAVFWFLDYTTALKDTSLFAALVVAIGYQQIFAGGVQGIVMPGQTSRLWKPFEAWVQAIAGRIAVTSKRAKDRFEESVKRFIAADAERTQRLQSLAVEYTGAHQQLAADLQAIANESLPTGLLQEEFNAMVQRRRIQRLIDEVRASMPQQFADLLRERSLVNEEDYWLWFRRLKAKITATVFAVILVICAAVGLRWFWSDVVQLRYYEWRFLKTNASEVDHYRSREYLAERLRMLSQQSNSSELTTTPAAALRRIVAHLRYRNLSSQSAAEIERLLVDFHSPTVDEFAIPELIEALKNENSDIRLHVSETLKALHDADFKDPPLAASLEQWVPKKDESPAEIANYAGMWTAWWNARPHH